MKKTLLTLTSLTLTCSSLLALNISVNAGADGFTGWTESNSSGNPSENGRFTSGSGTGMDTSGVSWGLYANTSQTASNIYDFGGILQAGETVTISISLGNIVSGGTVGFGLQNSGGTNRFETYYIGEDSSDTFKLNDAEGQENISGPTTSFTSSSWSNNNFQTIEFTQETGNTYRLKFNGVDVTNPDRNLTASDISQIRIFNFNAGSGGASNQYFNSLSVVPEPSIYAAIGGTFALMVALLRHRLRK